MVWHKKAKAISYQTESVVAVLNDDRTNSLLQVRRRINLAGNLNSIPLLLNLLDALMCVKIDGPTTGVGSE